MTTNFYIPEDHAPLPPANAEVITTACDYCIVACGYKVYRWPLEKANGGQKGLCSLLVLAVLAILIVTAIS
ncbi:hypothetical protein [Moritella viscosa]|uniref:hypothetical protein n=1 Tax=Moritella viscosa TaxID=80854 RepID=UPI0005D3556B|nr:hypothetical protein [Moritella viscosa]